KTVVLDGNLHLSCGRAKDWVVASPMSELQLVGSPAQGQTKNLMAKTDTENRLLANQLAYRVDGVGDGLGISWAIGEKDSVGIQAQDLTGSRCRWHDSQLATVVCQQSKNIVLDAKVESGHFERRWLLPGIGAS